MKKSSIKAADKEAIRARFSIARQLKFSSARNASCRTYMQGCTGYTSDNDPSHLQAWTVSNASFRSDMRNERRRAFSAGPSSAEC